MKYYIAFAENSIEGHLESGPRKPQGDQEQIRDLISKLQNAKVCLKFNASNVINCRGVGWAVNKLRNTMRRGVGPCGYSKA